MPLVKDFDPDESANVIRIVARAAEGVDYAHSEGGCPSPIVTRATVGIWEKVDMSLAMSRPSSRSGPACGGSTG